MNVFGIIMIVILVAFALAVLTLYSLPYIIAEVKSFKERIATALRDKKLDIEKKSEERQHRDEIKRAKQFELANKKLDAKLQKLDKQIKILDEKQAIAKQMKTTAMADKVELKKVKKPVVAEPVKEVKVEEVKEEAIEEVPVIEEPIVEERFEEPTFVEEIATEEEFAIPEEQIEE